MKDSGSVRWRSDCRRWKRQGREGAGGKEWRRRWGGGVEVGRIVDATPAAQDSLGKAAAHSMAKCHADEGCKARDRPRGRVEEGVGDGLASSTTQITEEADGGRAEGPKDADREDDKAHARRQRTVLALS